MIRRVVDGSALQVQLDLVQDARSALSGAARPAPVLGDRMAASDVAGHVHVATRRRGGRPAPGDGVGIIGPTTPGHPSDDGGHRLVDERRVDELLGQRDGLLRVDVTRGRRLHRERAIAALPVGGHGELVERRRAGERALGVDRHLQLPQVDGLGVGDRDQVDEILHPAAGAAGVGVHRRGHLLRDLIGDREQAVRVRLDRAPQLQPVRRIRGLHSPDRGRPHDDVDRHVEQLAAGAGVLRGEHQPAGLDSGLDLSESRLPGTGQLEPDAVAARCSASWAASRSAALVAARSRSFVARAFGTRASIAVPPLSSHSESAPSAKTRERNLSWFACTICSFTLRLLSPAFAARPASDLIA
ncbi:unnamed protein product [Penicillium discolor]